MSRRAETVWNRDDNGPERNNKRIGHPQDTKEPENRGGLEQTLDQNSQVILQLKAG
jgi:hypothetical protein